MDSFGIHLYRMMDSFLTVTRLTYLVLQWCRKSSKKIFLVKMFKNTVLWGKCLCRCRPFLRVICSWYSDWWVALVMLPEGDKIIKKNRSLLKSCLLFIIYFWQLYRLDSRFSYSTCIQGHRERCYMCFSNDSALRIQN